MDQDKKNVFTDMLAELITAPVALGVAAVQTKRQVEKMPTGRGTTVGEEVENAANKVKAVAVETVKKIQESETTQKVKEAVNETVQKLSDPETAKKVKDTVNETVQKVAESETVKGVKEAAAKTGEAVKELAGKVKESVEKPEAEAAEDACETKEEQPEAEAAEEKPEE